MNRLAIPCRSAHQRVMRIVTQSLALGLILFTMTSRAYPGSFKAGAVVVDVTPRKLPVIVNGGFTSRSFDKVLSPLSARALAFSDGKTQVVLVAVDSCMMPRDLLDEAKALASEKTGVPTANILISATHTHTAGSCMGALGTPADPVYPHFLKGKLVEAIAGALGKLQPARVGFARVNAAKYTALRRWVRRPDRIELDPFGNPTVRANMHAGRDWDNVTGESGPEDPWLSLVSVQNADGKPLCVYANFSMHYFGGGPGIHADYYGLFCDGLKQKLAPEGDFVGIMSHGCSGDIWRRDYTDPDSWDPSLTMEAYADAMVWIAAKALEDIQYDGSADLAMAERRLDLAYRVPDAQRLEWAKKIVVGLEGRLPKTKEEVYAVDQVILHERQRTEVVTQALRIGDIAIATTPNETYAITGLKIKAASPLEKTIVLDLANGGDGYIPPPEQHLLGGYNTWAARSAGLEPMAERKIAESCIALLEEVSGNPRKFPVQSKGPAAKVILGLEPLAYYRMDEFQGARALDSSGNHRDGIYEPQVAYYLEGPLSTAFNGAGEPNRSVMFTGNRMCAHLPELGADWSVSLWFWNGMPNDGREFSGWILSRGNGHGLSNNSLHLGVGGKSGYTGRLVLQAGAKGGDVIPGQTSTPRWEWKHLLLSKSGSNVRVYLDGELEICARDVGVGAFQDMFFGGRSDNDSNWEGRLDEIAVFGRALGPEEALVLAGKN